MLFSLLWFVKSQTGQKVLLAIILLGLAGTALWVYGKRQYNKGKDQGIRDAYEQVEQQKQEEWKARDDELRTKADLQTRDAAAIAKRSADLDKIRAGLNTTLAEIRARYTTSQEISNEMVNSIPGDQLDAAIRELSKRLGPPADTAPRAPSLPAQPPY